MQEEVENRTVNLAITTTKLSFRSLYAAYMKYRHYRSERKTVKEQKRHRGRRKSLRYTASRA